MAGGVLSGQHGTEGETAAAVCGVGDGNKVGLGVVGDGMDARHFAFADGIDAEEVGGSFLLSFQGAVGQTHLSLHPTVLAVEFGTDLFGQCDGRAARRVEFVYVVRFHLTHVVAGIGIHDTGQVLVDSREDGHAEREITGPEERVALLRTGTAHVGLMVGEPARTSAHHLHALFPSAEVIAVGGGGGGKFDGNVRTAEGVGVEVAEVVCIDNRYNFVATLQGDFFNHVPHLSIAYQCYFHLCFFLILRSLDFGCKVSARRMPSKRNWDFFCLAEPQPNLAKQS